VLIVIFGLIALDSTDGVDGGVEDGHEKGEHLPSVDDKDDQSYDTEAEGDNESGVDANLGSGLLEGSALITIDVKDSSASCHSLLNFIGEGLVSHFGMFSV